MSGSQPPVPAKTFDHCETADWPTQIGEVLSDGRDVAAETWRYDGREAPLTVLHAWLAASVAPLLIDAVARDGQDTRSQRAVQELHHRAAQGETISADTWRTALEPALREVYRRAYSVGQAFAAASAAAASFALSRGYSEADAAEYGRTYAEMNTEANLSAYADANASALADLLSQSFESADAAGYARTFPGAYVRACLNACTAEGDADAAETRRRRAALADGLMRGLRGSAAAV